MRVHLCLPLTLITKTKLLLSSVYLAAHIRVSPEFLLGLSVRSWDCSVYTHNSVIKLKTIQAAWFNVRVRFEFYYHP